MVLTDTNELVRTVTLWEIPADLLKEGEKEAIRHGWTKAYDPDDRPYWTHASGEKCWKMPKVFEQAGQDIVLEGAAEVIPQAVPKPEERGGMSGADEEEIEEMSDQETEGRVPVEPAGEIDPEQNELEGTVVDVTDRRGSLLKHWWGKQRKDRKFGQESTKKQRRSGQHCSRSGRSGRMWKEG